MNETRDARFNELLCQAVELPDDEHEAFLESVCDDSELRREVLEAIRGHDDLGDFLEQPVVADLADTAEADGSADAGDSTVVGRPRRSVSSTPRGAVRVEPGPEPDAIARIGLYKILEEIGSGGMGRVFLAEQTEPIRRRVALKLMKTSLAGANAAARFAAERQAMARLSHANVAHILDGGTTEDGNPFFVMEHVAGEPITRYCDHRALRVAERLRIFLDVCAAVQHAHLNQILHRDLKPSNVLVSDVDGRPVVKIIDFGIAKALDIPLTEDSLDTGDQLIGTPTYMSPEALRKSPPELGGPAAGTASAAPQVDTRTDVYSLGVLLYVLLAGAAPFSTRDGLGGMIRQVLEDEPPLPSCRVSSMPETVCSQVAESRQVAPLELERLLRGDLDWIVKKAIARNPDERYASAAELAAEIRRYLDHEPVLASPQTLRYRFGKLVRRHRLAVTAVAAALLALVAGVAGTTFGFIRARHEAEQARQARAEEATSRREAEQVTQFLVDLFEDADPEKSRGADVTARELLDRGALGIQGELSEQPGVQARMMLALGKVYVNLDLAERAAPLVEESLRLRRGLPGDHRLEIAECLVELGVVYRHLGRLDDAEELATQGLELQESTLGTRAPVLVDTLRKLASISTTHGDFARSEQRLRRALEIGDAALDAASPLMGRAASALAACYAYQGRFDDAEPLFRRALAIHRQAFGDDHPRVATNLNSLALIASNTGRHAEAQELYRQSLEIYEKVGINQRPASRRGWSTRQD